MPKEIVYGDTPPFGTINEPGSARSIVEVRWDRETEYFQIATKCVEAATGETWDPPQAIGTGGTNTFTLAPPTPTVFDGFYVDLDRRGINTLIRHLRRARDAAFGRDE